jgi:MFS family permease
LFFTRRRNGPYLSRESKCDAQVTHAQQHITLAISAIVGLTLLVITGLTFLVQPMAEDLALPGITVELALVAPSIAALLVVFVAGRAGDWFGERKTIIAAGMVFTLGAGILATASIDPAVIVGLAMCGAGSAVIQVVALSLLKRTIPDGKARVQAFTTFGMVFPAAFLVFPIATSFLLGFVNWRWVPASWSVGGVVVVVIALLILDRDRLRTGSGEWASPILAGIALATGSRMLQEISREEGNPIIIAMTATFCTVATVACVLVVKRARNPGLSLRPLRGAMVRPLLFGIAIIALIQILTYISIALRYFYDMSPLEASLAIAPAQVGAVIGAKIVASGAIRAWGISRSGRDLLLLTGLVMLLLVFVQPGTPAWYLVLVATAFSLTGMAALTVMNLDIMGRTPQGSAGIVSSYRTAASSLGATMSMVVLGVAVLSSVSIASGSGSVSGTQVEALAAALRVDGVIGFIIAVIGWAVLYVSSRQDRTTIRIGNSV